MWPTLPHCKSLLALQRDRRKTFYLVAFLTAASSSSSSRISAAHTSSSTSTTSGAVSAQVADLIAAVTGLLLLRSIAFAGNMAFLTTLFCQSKAFMSFSDTNSCSRLGCRALGNRGLDESCRHLVRSPQVSQNSLPRSRDDEMMRQPYELRDTSRVWQCRDCGALECTAIQMFYGIACLVERTGEARFNYVQL